MKHDVNDIFEAFLKLSKGEQKRLHKLVVAAMEQEPEEGIVPPPLPPPGNPGGPPVGP